MRGRSFGQTIGATAVLAVLVFVDSMMWTAAGYLMTQPSDMLVFAGAVVGFAAAVVIATGVLFVVKFVRPFVPLHGKEGNERAE